MQSDFSVNQGMISGNMARGLSKGGKINCNRWVKIMEFPQSFDFVGIAGAAFEFYETSIRCLNAS